VIDRYQGGELDLKAAQLGKSSIFGAGALRRAVIDGDVENGSLMAGQSVAFVTREQPVAEILAELIGQTTTAWRHGVAKTLQFDRSGVLYSELRREELWDKFYTQGLRRRTASELSYSNLKKVSLR
jgi:hypothetical protein